MLSSFKPKARTSDLVVQDLPDEVLIYDLNSHKAHCLNATASTIWRACSGTRTEAEIAENVGAGMPLETIMLGVDQLASRGLLESGRPRPASAATRREAIRAIGVSAAVAIPVITSLVVPQTVLATISCAGCTSNATCANRPNCPSLTCNANGVCSP